MQIEKIEYKRNLKATHRTNKFRQAFIAFSKTGKKIVELKIYDKGENNNTACVWIRGVGVDACGSGYARGWGFNHQTAASEEAFMNAGVTFKGFGNIHEAVELVAMRVAGEGYAFTENIYP